MDTIGTHLQQEPFLQYISHKKIHQHKADNFINSFSTIHSCRRIQLCMIDKSLQQEFYLLYIENRNLHLNILGSRQNNHGITHHDRKFQRHNIDKILHGKLSLPHI